MSRVLRSEKVVVISASAFGATSAAPRPWMARAAMSISPLSTKIARPACRFTIQGRCTGSTPSSC